MEHMKIETRSEENHYLISLDGDLDASTSILLDEELIKAKEIGGKILVDCERLNYISSAGLGVFMSHLSDFEAANTALILYNLSEKVQKVFEILGLHELLKIVPSKEEAILTS